MLLPLPTDTGAWQLSGKAGHTEMEQLDLTSVSVMTSLYPVLSTLATRTTVVFNLPDPFKEHIVHDFCKGVPNDEIMH